MATYTLSGSGTQAVSTPASLALVITTPPSYHSDGRATPANRYDVGLLRLGTSHGYLPAFPIDATNQLIPCPVGTTLVGYTLLAGAVITLEERTETLQPTSVVANSQIPPASDIITPFGGESLGVILAASATAVAASGGYAVANAAHYYPFRLSAPFTSAYAFWGNGGAVSGHVDVGVYDSSFNRLGSVGSTVQAGLQSVQSVALVVALTPGLYYLAIAADNTTATIYNAVTAAPRNWITGARRQTSAFPLPNPGVPIASSAVGNVYLCGLSTYQP